MTTKDLIAAAFKKQYEEAMKNPPKTLDGHIANENGITNDYRGRAIYEFFQNAIDRAESKIWIHLDKASKRLIIANDGQPFSIEKNNDGDGKSRKYSDFESLCSINTSSKNQNESIGNKGVGFKSCWEYTEKVTICSIHNKVKWGFNLYNPLNIDQLGNFENIPTKVIEWLKKDEYETVINRHGKLPSFYFPERIINVDEQFSENILGAETVITFHDLSPESIIDIEKKIGEFSNHQIFFVQQLEKLKDKDVKLELKIDSEIKELHTKHSEEQWLVVSENFKNKAKDKEELIALSENLNYKVENPKVAIAFPLKGQEVESKFYCYLPTEVNCGFNILIHADFLLDVSRKQIDFNNNSYNEKLLEHLALLLVDTFINHQDKSKLYKLDDFAEFINPKDTEEKLKGKVWSYLKENLMTILPSVYTNEYKSDSDYVVLFDAMSNWVKKHESYADWGNYYKEVYKETLKYFCNENIFIVPTGSVSVSTLPARENSVNKLFYKGKDEESFNISSDIIKHFDNIAISNFDELERFNLLRELKIVRPYSTIEIVRALLGEGALEDQNIAVLRFIYQIRDSLYKSKSTELTDLLFKIQLPCTGKGMSWAHARQCFYELDQSALCLTENEEVYPLNIDSINSWLNTSESSYAELSRFLDTLGCWKVLPLRIDAKKTKLPWNNIPQVSDCKVIKDAINKAIPIWKNSVEGLEEIQSELKSQEWFRDEINKKFVSPKMVFLFNDKRVRNCIAQETKEKNLDEFYSFLGIQSILDTDDPKKLIDQIKQMAKISPIDDHHKTVYKQCILRISSFKEFLLSIKQLPLLTTSGVYINNEVANDKAWFVPQEQKRYTHHFDLQFVNFDPATPRSFIEQINNLEVFEPDYLLKSDQDKLFPDPHKLKIVIEEKWLAKIFALAESTLSTSVFDKNDCMLRWNNLKIQYADDVWLELKLSGHERKVLYKDDGDNKGRNDVLFKPLSPDDRSKHKDRVGDIIYDLQEPLTNPYFNKFGYVISDAIFRNIAFGDVLSNYLQKAKMALSDSNSELEMDFLTERGVHKHDIAQMQRFISDQLLSYEDKLELIRRLKTIPGLNDESLSEDNWNDLSYYLNLKNELSFTTIREAFIDEQKFQSVVEQLNPQQHNLNLLFKQREDIKLKVFISTEKTMDDSDFSMAVEELKNQDLLLSYKFDIKDVYAKFGINPSKIYDEIELELARIKIDSGLTTYNFSTPEKQNKSEIKSPKIYTIGDEGNGNFVTRKISQESRENTLHEQSRRGIGVEKGLALKYASEIIKYQQVDTLKEKIETVLRNDDFSGKDDFLDVLKSANDLKDISKILQVSESIGDGLGYDILQPVFDQGGLTDILKVEIKTSKDGQQIHLSENERQKIIHFDKNDSSWRLYHYFGNGNEPIDRTEAIKNAVRKHKETYNGEQLLAAESWLIDFGG